MNKELKRKRDQSIATLVQKILSYRERRAIAAIIMMDREQNLIWGTLRVNYLETGNFRPIQDYLIDLRDNFVVA